MDRTIEPKAHSGKDGSSGWLVKKAQAPDPIRTREHGNGSADIGTGAVPLQQSSPLQALRHALGNQGFGRFVRAKLTIGQPGDRFEQEADRVADQVMRMPDPASPAPAASVGEGVRIQRMCQECEEEMQKKETSEEPLPEAEEEPVLRAKAVSDSVAAGPPLESHVGAIRSGGEPLPVAVRNFFEPRFGHDFSQVRIHTDGQAAATARAVDALAYTTGQNIVFGAGQYESTTAAGQRLLAHELTHTIQQGHANPALQQETLIQRALAPMEISAIADEIRSATQGLGTDEERIFRNLQRLNRDPADIQALMAAYQSNYHESLEALLRDEMSGSELRLALEEINIKDDPRAGNLIAAAAPNNPAEYRFAAQRLQSAMAGLGTDEETIYAVLIPFNRDPVKLSELKLAYLSLTHNALIADIKDEMSSTELDYALFLLNTTAETDDTADTMKGMVGTEAGWLPYGTASGNTFEKWASAPTEAAAPPLSGATTINCWEMILYAAYKAAAIDWQWIHNLYGDYHPQIDSSKWVSAMTSSLSNYSAGDKLTRGQLVFFDGLAHVTLATGNGDEVYTFWPPPNIPITPVAPGSPPVATIDKVKTSSIRILSSWMTTEYRKTPVVQVGDPAWWVSH